MSARRHVVVVGGGLAGASFATRLATAGREVVLLEREAGPHDKVCGEFLSHEALFYLKGLGVDPASLGAVPVRRVILAKGARSVARRLPFDAASLSRRVLDEHLLTRAIEAGASVVRGYSVRSIDPTPEGWTARLQDGREFSARHAALACGKHDLRGLGREPGIQNDLIGLKMHFRLGETTRRDLAETVVIGLFAGGYAGLEPIEGGWANLCLVVRKSRFAACSHDWRTLLDLVGDAAPAVGRALIGAEARHEKPLAISRIPYGLVVRTSPDGCWRLGDQAAVAPSFAGEGMSLALHSASLAADAMVDGRTAASYQARFAEDVGARVRMAARLSRAITAEPTQTLAALLCRAFPSSLSTLATATRIPHAALG